MPSKGGRRGQLRYRPGKAQATRGCQAVSLAFFPALRAYKVKGKVETFLKKSFIKKLYARFARPPARTCAVLLMSTSEASCHGRELTAEALRRELPGVQPPRIESPGTGPGPKMKKW